MEEIWINIRPQHSSNFAITDVSNLGRVRYSNGTVKVASMYGHISVNGVRKEISHIIAESFVNRDNENQTLVDHRSHNPVGMNINDFRNLRWCTHKENSNFEEAKTNMVTSMTGKPKTEFGKWFLSYFPDGVKGHRNEYAYYYNQYKETGELPTKTDFDEVYKGPQSEFAAWFNKRYGSGNKNRALYQRCRRHYRETGEFLEV